MIYSFNNYQFNSDDLVLTKDEEVISIRHNEAKVLQLLLEQTEKVLSKEDILTHVWQDKVVSEQAIFQNISHLRNIFGNASIKTFPKRGYQWQVEFDVIPPKETNTPSNLKLADQTLIKVTSPAITYKKVVIAFACIFTILTFVMYQYFEQTLSKKSVNIAYIPFDEMHSSEDFSLIGNNNLQLTPLKQFSTAQYRAASELEYLTIAKDHPLLLTGYVRKHKDLFYLDFVLKGPFDEWEGQLSGNTKIELEEKLLQHLEQPFIFKLLTEQQLPETKQANLLIAHQKLPNDLIILEQLIRNYIRINEDEKAMSLADKLINSAKVQSNEQQVGTALLFQSNILIRKELFELGLYKLKSALKLFEKVDDFRRQSDVWNIKSWLAHRENDYLAIKRSLLKSAEFALLVNDIERELAALTYLSVLAHKHDEDEEKYYYLTQAENKMKAYKLPLYRFAVIPFHHAIFTIDPLAKEPHLKQVLEYSELTPNHWIAQSSRQQLMSYFIQQDRLADAEKLIEGINFDNAENLYLKTLLSEANGQQELFESHAQKAFELAQLAGNKILSLDLALLLCSSPSTQINFDYYSQYINEFATSAWRGKNKDKLTAIDL